MKKFKKLITLMLALVMTMSMGLTAFAADAKEYTVNVENAQADTQIKWIKAIEEDTTSRTGFAFTEAGKAAFEAAFASTDDQAIIEALTSKNYTSAQFARALGNVVNNAGDKMNTGSTSFKVKGAGLYVVTAADAEYTYMNMAATVEFGSLGTTVDLSLKRSEVSLDKETTDADKVSMIGEKIDYTISVNVPYINTNDTNKTFFVYDKITKGGVYDLTNASVKIGDTVVGTIVPNADNNAFSVDLSALIDDTNSNVNKTVVVSYSVVVTDVEVENEATAGHEDGSEFGSDKVNVFTGKVELTKYAEKEAETNKLAGAKFVLKNEAGKFAVVAEGKLVSWAEKEDAATVLVTDAQGKIEVAGLDIGSYAFHEVEAPAGYAVTLEDAVAKVALKEGVEKATSAEDFDSVKAATKMIDGKLGSLPFTGGMGTTLFTVLGVAIMALAAALFFATKKNAAR